jgi:hypothetical protein
MSKQPFSLRPQMMCSNSMKCGVVCGSKTKLGGCGHRCAAEPATSSPLPWETKAKRPAFGDGKPSRMHTTTAIPSVIFGMPLNTCSQLKPIMGLGRKVGRLRIWNAGTTPCVNEWAATFEKRCPFPHLIRIMIWLPSGLLFSIIWVYHLPSNHCLLFNQCHSPLPFNDGQTYCPQKRIHLSLRVGLHSTVGGHKTPLRRRTRGRSQALLIDAVGFFGRPRFLGGTHGGGATR